MAIGPNSKWRCNPDCTCPQSKTHQHRCAVKRQMVERGEHLLYKINNVLYKLDLSDGKYEVRWAGQLRTTIKDWMWKQ